METNRLKIWDKFETQEFLQKTFAEMMKEYNNHSADF